MNFRKSEPKDVNRILEIIEMAKEELKKNEAKSVAKWLSKY